MVAPALLAGGDDHIAPVVDASVSAVAREPHYGALARDRHYPGDAKLRRFLQGSIHPISARHTLCERDGERRLALRSLPRYHAGARVATGNPRQLGGELPAVTLFNGEGGEFSAELTRISRDRKSTRLKSSNWP